MPDESLLKFLKAILLPSYATTGLSAGSGPKLHLKKENEIPEAILDIRLNSLLVLENVVLSNLTCMFSNKAKAIISGALLAAFKSN